MNHLFSLKNKIIVISGAAGMLGRQHADAVAAMGGIPVLLDLYKKPVKKLAKELKKKYGVRAKGYEVDITNEKSVRKNCSKLINQFGKIDGLINNAANNPKVEASSKNNFSRLENFPIKQWNKDLSVSLTGSFLCAKYYGFAISNNKNGGVILNISSDLGILAPDQRLYHNPGVDESLQPVKPISYSIAKSGLIGLTRYLATYWPTKVRCNAICPGGVFAGQNKAFLKLIEQRIPMKRMANKSEYQGIVIFLLSEASSYLNGAAIPVDGGRSVW